jgi:hypothetical protein
LPIGANIYGHFIDQLVILVTTTTLGRDHFSSCLTGAGEDVGGVCWRYWCGPSRGAMHFAFFGAVPPGVQWITEFGLLWCGPFRGAMHLGFSSAVPPRAQRIWVSLVGSLSWCNKSGFLWCGPSRGEMNLGLSGAVPPGAQQIWVSLMQSLLGRNELPFR